MAIKKKTEDNKNSVTQGAGELIPSVVPYVTGSEIDPTTVTSTVLNEPHLTQGELSKPILRKGRIN